MPLSGSLYVSMTLPSLCCCSREARHPPLMRRLSSSSNRKGRYSARRKRLVTLLSACRLEQCCMLRSLDPISLTRQLRPWA